MLTLFTTPVIYLLFDRLHCNRAAGSCQREEEAAKFFCLYLSPGGDDLLLGSLFSCGTVV